MSDFVIKDGVLLAYTGTDEEVHIPDFLTEIAPGCFAEAIRVRSIYLPTTIQKIGENALGIATVYTAIIPGIRNYVFRENYGRFGRWRWYEEPYFKEYSLLHQKESACEEQLKQIEERKEKKNKPYFVLSAILSLTANILLWCYWPWITDTMGWLCAPLPKLISAVVYAIVFGALWLGLFFVIGVIAYMFSGDAAYYEEETALKKQLEELKARISEMKEHIEFKEWELDRWVYGDSPVRAAGASVDPTWHNGLSWTANYGNAKDM